MRWTGGSGWIAADLGAAAAGLVGGIAAESACMRVARDLSYGVPNSHVVGPDESMAVIASRYGFRDWRLIYHHPANAAFRAKCPEPNLLTPGTELQIPDRGDVPAYSRSTGAEHAFVVARNDDRLQLRIVGPDQAPRVGWRYEIDIDGVLHTGSVPEDGRISVPLGKAVARADLKVWPARGPEPSEDDILEILVGGLRPAHEPHGQQARLVNLGLLDDEPDGDLSRPGTRAALRQLGDPTPAELARRHGC